STRSTPRPPITLIVLRLPIWRVSSSYLRSSPSPTLPKARESVTANPLAMRSPSARSSPTATTRPECTRWQRGRSCSATSFSTDRAVGDRAIEVTTTPTLTSRSRRRRPRSAAPSCTRQRRRRR
ncbi:hypothetical protein PFISCL1PPCAC_13923, partial [Pristionchus fissidentatus]